MGRRRRERMGIGVAGRWKRRALGRRRQSKLLWESSRQAKKEAVSNYKRAVTLCSAWGREVGRRKG
jgi:hypothetical protein